MTVRPLARRSCSLSVAAAAGVAQRRHGERAEAELDDGHRALGQADLREATVRPPAVTLAVPRSTWRVGLATSTVALPAWETVEADWG